MAEAGAGSAGGAGERTANETVIALGLLTAVSALLIWWEWKQAAYFGRVFYPGAIGIFALLVLLLVNGPVPARIAGPARVALLALVGLSAWTLLSLLWTSVPAAPIAYAERIAVYATLFTVGLWAIALLGRRMHLALLPVALTGAVVGVTTVVVLATGTDVSWYLQGDATLRFPIGYRNADVSFLLICVWPLLGLAAHTEWRWPLRALAIAAATVLIDLAILGQSRGSLPALGVALCVYLLLSPHRLRAGVVILLALLPILPFLDDLLAVFRYNSPDSGIVPLLRDAARATGFSAALSLLLASLALGLVYPRLHLGPARVRAVSWVAGALVVLVAVSGGIVFLARHGGPVEFIDQRVDEFSKTGYPNLHSQGIRFGANVGSNRHDFWRVAVNEGLEQPLLGGGAGSFQLAYIRERESPEEPHDPHSIEAAVFSELGFPGLLLLVAFVVGAGWAALRSRRVSPLAAGLVATACAGAVQWLVHGSWDWFWQYAGVTGLGTYLLGVAAAPGLGDRPPRRAFGPRAVSVLALVVLALVAVPLFLSDRYISRANEEASGNPLAAIDDLDRAASLNPFDDDSLLARGAVEAGIGRRAAAVSSYREAADREPDNYVPYLFIAHQLADVDPAAARAALNRAAELNPRGREIAELRRELRRQRPGASAQP